MLVAINSKAMAFAKPNIYHEHYLAALAHYAHRKMKFFEAREVSNALWSFTIFSKNIVDQNWCLCWRFVKQFCFFFFLGGGGPCRKMNSIWFFFQLHCSPTISPIAKLYWGGSFRWMENKISTQFAVFFQVLTMASKPTVPRLDHALEHFLDLVQKRHYEGWELVQAARRITAFVGSFGREGGPTQHNWWLFPTLTQRGWE